MNLRAMRIVASVGSFLIRTVPERSKLFKLAETDPKKSNELAQVQVQNILQKVIDIAGVDIEVRGLENIPEEPCLYVGNHQSYFDIIVAETVIPGGVGFIAKDDLGKIPGFKPWMDLIHCLLLDRENAKAAIKTLLKGVDNIKDGYSMFIYPEGTRSKTGELGEFKGGGLKIAQKAKCPVVPVAVTGTRDIFENNPNLNIKPGHVTITFGEPIHFGKIPRSEQKQVLDSMKDTIKELM